MARFLTRNRGFILKVAFPAVVVLAVAIGASWVVLAEMVREVDRIEKVWHERSARAALQANLDRLSATHGDYAVWNHAVLHLYGAVDPAFAHENYELTSQAGKQFDGAYLLDENDRDLFGFQRGTRALRHADEEFGSAIHRLIDDVRKRPHPFDAHAGYVEDRSGSIVAVAIGSIQPASAETLLPAGEPRLLILTRRLDTAGVDRLRREFAVDGLHLVKGDGSGQAGVPILDPSGRKIAILAWQPPVQGTEALRRVAPIALAATTLIIGAMGFLLVIGFRNLQEVRRREREALRSADHDGLTGLPNRRGLGRELDAAAAGSNHHSGNFAVIYLDLDGFKEVNDAYGHDVGDQLLATVAATFAEICEGVGMLARVGGDEFAVVIREPGSAQVADDTAKRMIGLFDEPFDVGGRQLQISTSAGVAVTSGEAISAEEMLRRADVAMYQAKESGRNRVAFYDPSIDANRAERLRLAEDLRIAIRDDHLAVVYQPIFEAGTMRPSGVEALIRWLHPEIGLVPPDKFVPIAEENGLIERIGEWVLHRACLDALNWPNVKLSVNVSPVQFRNPGFDQLLADVLADTGFPAQRLEIEMTETHLVANPERAQTIIASLRAIGVTVSLDDFGTGYSSIGYLRRFTFDKLKLDRSLVIDITTDNSARELCEATIALGRALHLSVTAEGVETEQEAMILRDAGCTHLQGFAFARPMPADIVGRFLVATLNRPLVLPWSA